MSKTRISVEELINSMVSDRRIAKKLAEEFVKVLLSTIEDALVNGESVKVKGLGTFKSQWSEPQKTVDESSGKEIVIDGYYKVVFEPEDDLKEDINEPFSHLEPVVLGAEEASTASDTQPDEVSDEVAQDDMGVSSEPVEPLRIFEEQAEEIKGLISEINSLSPSKPQENEAEKTEEQQAPVEEEIKPVEEVEDVSAKSEGLQHDEEPALKEEVKEIEKPIKPIQYIYEFDEFDTVRDLSLLLPESVQEDDIKLKDGKAVQVQEEVKEVEVDKDDDKTEEVADEKPALEDEKAEKIVEDKVVAEEERTDEEIASTEPVAAFVSEPLETASDEISEKEEPEIIEEETIEIKQKEVVQEEVTEEDFEEIFTEKEEEKARKKSVVTKVVIILLILIALAAIAWFLVNLRKYSEFKNNQKRVENIADSTAKALRVREISDSLAQVNSAYANLDSTIKSDDTLKLFEPQEVEELLSEAVSSENIFSLPRTYNNFIATEKMVAGSQLTRFARDYFGNPVFWVYIYEANKSKISDPNNVPAGIDIKIPKLDPKLIDTKNSECIEYAKKLQTEYLSQ